MKIFIFSLLISVFSSQAFADKTVIFTCDEGQITLENGDYSLGSQVLIYADEGKTVSLSKYPKELHVINTDSYWVQPESPDDDFGWNHIKKPV